MSPSALFSCSLDKIFRETPSYIWCHNVLTGWIHTLTFWKTLFQGVFAERSLGSQLKFSVSSACPPACHMQSTAALLCSMQGSFCGAVLSSWLKFSANSAQPAPCHMQSTAAHLCSMQGSFCGAVLGQSAQILSWQCSASTLSYTGDCGSPVLHVREISWTLLRRTTSPYIVS